MTIKITVEQIAKVCHTVNRAACITFGDLSQPRWEEAPDWQRKSCINGVRYTIANPNATPRESHNNWLHEKLSEGWAYGPTKDPILKTHPQMVSYDDLTEEERLKDYLFQAVVRSLTDQDSYETVDPQVEAARLQTIEDVEEEAINGEREILREREKEEALNTVTSPPVEEPQIRDQTWARDAMQVEENNKASQAEDRAIPRRDGPAPQDTDDGIPF